MLSFSLFLFDLALPRSNQKGCFHAQGPLESTLRATLNSQRIRSAPVATSRLLPLPYLVGFVSSRASVFPLGRRERPTRPLSKGREKRSEEREGDAGVLAPKMPKCQNVFRSMLRSQQAVAECGDLPSPMSPSHHWNDRERWRR